MGSAFKYLTNNFHTNIGGILPCWIPYNNRVHAFIMTLRPLNSQDAVSPCTLHMDMSTCICQDLINQSRFLLISIFLCKITARIKSRELTLSIVPTSGPSNIQSRCKTKDQMRHCNIAYQVFIIFFSYLLCLYGVTIGYLVHILKYMKHALTWCSQFASEHILIQCMWTQCCSRKDCSKALMSSRSTELNTELKKQFFLIG